MPKFVTPTVAVPFIVIAIALAGCGSGEPSAPAASDAASASADADLPGGWERVEITDEGFSIGLPDDWGELSAQDLADSGVMEGMASANPEAAGVLGQAQAAIESGQIAFFAFDAEPSDATSTFAANVNVINAGEAEGSAADAAGEMATAIGAQIPVNGEVTTETATLPAGEAGVVRYEWTVTAADGTSNDVAVTQYAILADGAGYILSFSTLVAEVGEYEPIFTDMAESFRVE